MIVNMKTVLQIQLLSDQIERAVFKHTMRGLNKACNYIVTVIVQEQCASNFALIEAAA